MIIGAVLTVEEARHRFSDLASAPPIPARIMSHKSNQFWTFVALPVSLLILASAYYLRVSAVREAIDARTPIVHQLLGRWVRDSSPTVVVENRPRPADPSVADGA